MSFKIPTCFLVGPLAGSLVSCRAMTSGSWSLIVFSTSLDNKARAESLVSAAFNESIFHEINFIVPSIFHHYYIHYCFSTNLQILYHISIYLTNPHFLLIMTFKKQ